MYFTNPPLFLFNYLSIFLLILVRIKCNEMLEDREVVCSSDRMVVNLSFRNPFNGIVFVQGQFNNEKCKWQGNGGHYLLVILPLGRPSFCGIRWDPIIGEHSVMLIVSNDAQILTQQSLSLSVSCVHARKEQSLTLTIGSPSIDSGFRTIDRESIASLLGRAPAIPSFSLQIRDAHGLAGQILNEAAIGQRLTLDATISDNTFYDIFVHGCIAHDGSRNSEASIQIIDDNGCAISLPRAVDGPTMISPQNENGGGNGHPKHVFVYFYGFQFTTGPIVYFECQITLCMAPCAVKQCNENSAIHGSTSATISTRIVKTQLIMRPQILQPISIAPHAEKLIGEIQPTKQPIYANLINCTNLAWLLILLTFSVLLCISIWTIFIKLHKIITGIYKAIKA